MMGGSYLSFFFVISHNFDGAQALTDTTRPSNKGCEKNSFLYKQVPLIPRRTLQGGLWIMNWTERKPEKIGMLGGLVWKPVTVPSGTQQLSFWLARAAPEAELLIGQSCSSSRGTQQLSFWLARAAPEAELLIGWWSSSKSMTLTSKENCIMLR